MIRTGSVLGAARVVAPRLEGKVRRREVRLEHRHQFRTVPVEVLVEEGIVEARRGGTVPVRREVHPSHAGPQSRGQAKRAQQLA